MSRLPGELRAEAPRRARSARARAGGHALYADYSPGAPVTETGAMRRHCGECGGMRYFNFGVSLVHHCGSSASCPAGCTEVAKEGVVLPHAPPANSELWATGAIPLEPVVGICGHGNGHAAGTKRSTAAPVPGDRRDGGSAARAVRLCVLGRLSCGAEDRRRADRTLARGRARACLESVRGGRPRVPPRR